MPLIPEKLSSRHGSRAAIASQFWESAEHSTRYIDGQAWELPCEPPALNLTGSSGLSRSQQLIAAQSLGLPAFPSYDGNSGGLVLDRVLANFGGRQWWTALSSRFKVQRMYMAATESGRIAQALQDLGSYAMCARSRVQLGPRLVLNAVVEAPDGQLLKRSFQRANAAPGRAVPHRAEESLAAHASLRATLPGHDLVATVGRNLDYVESSGDYARVPKAVSLDLSSHDRADGLQYRVGLHQVTAPPTEGRGQRGSRTVLHAQGAVAVEGEAYVWRGGGSGASAVAAASAAAGAAPVPAPAPAPVSGVEKEDAAAQMGADRDGEAEMAAARKGSAAAAEGEEAEGGSASKGGRVLKVLASAAAADSGEKDSGGRGSQLQEATKEMLEAEKGSADATTTTTTSAAAETDKSGAPEAAKTAPSAPPLTSLEAFIAPLSQLGEAMRAVTGHAADHGSSKGDPANKNAPRQTGVTVSAPPQPPPRPHLLPVTSQSVTAAIADSLAALHQLKDTVSRVTSEVQDGSLQRLSQQLSVKQPQRKRPHSVLLAQPHVKLNAAIGCLARMPLPHFRALVPGSAHDEAAGTLMAPVLPRRAMSGSSLASRTSLSSQLAEAWEPYLKGTALRVFLSAGISGQIGRFTRPFLDFTSAALRLDVGLSSPHVLGSVPGAGVVGTSLVEAGRPDKHRAFALEGSGSWHALSMSFAQQVVGPIRARADFRFALDPTNVPLNQGERSTLKGLAQTALSARPSMLEAVYGADIVLPGTEGAGRVAVWWSPKRKEAMAELRLF